MTYRYNGGDFSQSSRMHPIELFTCTDFNGGPPLEPGTLTYIQAFAVEGGGMFFEGLVPVGELCVLKADPRVSADMYFTMYDPRGSTDPAIIVAPENILQSIKYHSSCSQNLFLKDRFDSVQLVEFISEDQGRVSCFINTTLSVNFGIPISSATSESVRLTALMMITNPFGILDFTPVVAELIVQGGDTVEIPPFEINLCLTSGEGYTFSITVIGEAINHGGFECSGEDFYEFVAGNP
jgi:hypothetical protein